MTRTHHAPRPLVLAATGLTAVALALSMSACSSGSDSADTTNAPSGQASAAADTQTDANGNAVPEGFTTVEVPEYGVSVAVPSDWDTLTSANTSDTELVERIAQALDETSDEVIADLEDAALISIDTSAEDDAITGIFLTRDEENGALPTEETMRSFVDDDDNVDSTDYQETTSGSGADASIFTASGTNSAGVQRHLAAVAVSDGDDAFFMAIVGTTSEDRTQEISDAVLGSL